MCKTVGFMQNECMDNSPDNLDFVKDILTSKAVHPRGIKVRLDTGEVGRVQVIVD